MVGEISLDFSSSLFFPIPSPVNTYRSVGKNTIKGECVEATFSDRFPRSHNFFFPRVLKWEIDLFSSPTRKPYTKFERKDLLVVSLEQPQGVVLPLPFEIGPPDADAPKQRPGIGRDGAASAAAAAATAAAPAVPLLRPAVAGPVGPVGPSAGPATSAAAPGGHVDGVGPAVRAALAGGGGGGGGRGLEVVLHPVGELAAARRALLAPVPTGPTVLPMTERVVVMVAALVVVTVTGTAVRGAAAASAVPVSLFI